MTNVHQLEVVDRGSETQLQVGENLNNLIERFKVNSFNSIYKRTCNQLKLIYYFNWNKYYVLINSVCFR